MNDQTKKKRAKKASLSGQRAALIGNKKHIPAPHDRTARKAAMSRAVSIFKRTASGLAKSGYLERNA